MTVTNALIANNGCVGVSDGGYNLEWQGSPNATLTCGFTNHAQNGVDPGLAAGLANNGGPTQTLAVSSTGAAYLNGDGDVCRQTGMGNVNGVDQRGAPRPRGGPCTIGAFEPQLTSTSVSSSGSPSAYGQAVTFTADVSAVTPGFGIPTGTVAFYDGTSSTTPIACTNSGGRPWAAGRPPAPPARSPQAPTPSAPCSPTPTAPSPAATRMWEAATARRW